MSKLGPLAQSMAALFQSPDRAKGKETLASSNPSSSVRVPGGPKGTLASQKSNDSLGDGATPGYESWGKKKKAEGAPANEEKAGDPANLPHETPFEGSNLIRLSLGWEKLLVAQKKVCEKAKGLFTRLEGDVRYQEHRRGKMKFMKNRGCILDVDSVAVQDEKESEEKKARGAVIDTQHNSVEGLDKVKKDVA